jgi:hypothetical protein
MAIVDMLKHGPTKLSHSNSKDNVLMVHKPSYEEFYDDLLQDGEGSFYDPLLLTLL